MLKIQRNNKPFYIDETVMENYSDLIELIFNSDSMEDDNERQYWFDAIPTMKDIQIDNLYDILENERKKIIELDKKFDEEAQKLNEKHLIEWQEFQLTGSKNKIYQAEKEDKEKDSADEILLLLS